MIAARRYWGVTVTVNVVGGVLVWLGAGVNVGMYLSGLLLLLPGSAAAAAFPLQKLWRPILWRCCETDPTGLSDILYLPVAIAINLLVWWFVRFWTSKRKHAGLSKR